MTVNKNNSSNHTNNKAKEFDIEVLEYAELPKGYTPSEDEEYMNEMHLKYFRNKLLYQLTFVQPDEKVCLQY